MRNWVNTKRGCLTLEQEAWKHFLIVWGGLALLLSQAVKHFWLEFGDMTLAKHYVLIHILPSTKGRCGAQAPTNKICNNIKARKPIDVEANAFWQSFQTAFPSQSRCLFQQERQRIEHNATVMGQLNPTTCEVSCGNVGLLELGLLGLGPKSGRWRSCLVL